jgi:hypothetical protein
MRGKRHGIDHRTYTNNGKIKKTILRGIFNYHSDPVTLAHTLSQQIISRLFHYPVKFFKGIHPLRSNIIKKYPLRMPLRMKIKNLRKILTVFYIHFFYQGALFEKTAPWTPAKTFD